MQSKFTGKAMVFRRDHEGRAYYSTSIGRKNQDGTWDNAHINLQFKRDIELENKTEIDIGNGWLTFYKKGNIPVWQVFVNEFEVIGGTPDGFAALGDEEFVPF